MKPVFLRHFDRLHDFRQRGRVLVIYGARRVGKTTLVNRYLDGREREARVLRASGDHIRDREVLSSQDARLLLDWTGGYTTLFIDEAQHIPGVAWGLKLLIDNRPDLEIIATGSSSFDLSSKLGEPLTGRQVSLKMFPLSAGELRRSLNGHEINESLEDLLVFGMYPEVRAAASSEQKRFILNELADAYLLKDILQLERIKKPKVLVNLLTLVALQTGSEVSLNELSNTLKVDMKTVERYLDLLEKCFVLYNLRGFSRNLRQEVTKKSKYFFYDTGIRNALIQNFNPLALRNDTGALWENFMIIERLKFRSYGGPTARDYFWRTWEKQEIDLIEEYGGGLHAWEFKWSGKKSPRMPSAFQENYPDAEYHVVNPGNFMDCLTSAAAD
jgi:predicted AAA+ superfamily ATPase